MTAIAILVLFIIVLFILIIFHEDGILFEGVSKLKCRFGYHKMTRYKMLRYYCQFCKKPRKHPILKVIDGGNKIKDNKFRG